MTETVLDSNLLKSKYLCIFEEKGVFWAYHSLFGNLKRLNRAAVKLINFFDECRPNDMNLIRGNEHSIKALMKLNYLVPKDMDERRLIREKIERRSVQLIDGRLISAVQLSVSQLCNMECRYCLTDVVDNRSMIRSRMLNRGERLMRFSTAKNGLDKLLRLAGKHKKKRFVVKFFGREPLMNWPLISKLLDHFGNGSDYGLKICWHIGTNGTLLNDEIVRKFKAYDVSVFVSIDGVAEVNDIDRQTVEGAGSFERIDQAVKKLRQSNVDTVFTSVLSASNFDFYDERLIVYAAENDVKSLVLFLTQQNDPMACQGIRSAGEISQKLHDLYFYGKAHGVNMRGYWHNPLRRLLAMRKNVFLDEKEGMEDLASCSATGLQLAMEPSGDLFPCRAQSHHLGHIDNLENMLTSKAYYHQVMRTYMNVTACRDCELEGFCQGVCLGHCEYKYGDIYQPDPRYCDVYKKVTHTILSSLVLRGDI